MKVLIKSHMRRWIAAALIFAVCTSVLTACKAGSTGETAFTTALGPADAALPYQAVFAVDKDADERLLFAAQSFCNRTAELSGGSAVFSLIQSDNVLGDLKTGKADIILLEQPEIEAFAPITEAFRYKSYAHFAMSVNADETLQVLSDILSADVFAGFYAGSSVLLSRGTLDSKFKPSPRKESEDTQDTQSVSVTALSGATARAFSRLMAEASISKELEPRIHACSTPNAVVEFSYSELDTPALLTTMRARATEIGGESDSEDKLEASDSIEPEPFVITQAFLEIKPVWLVFAESGYEKLSQTNRAAVAEAAAYMVSDIDGVYLQYEQEMCEPLLAEGTVLSHDFAVTRIQALRLADEQAARLTGVERKLRDAVARIQ